MPRAYLHIGHSKTGTTALQTAFTASRADLARHGIRYPAETDTVAQVDQDTHNPAGNALIPFGPEFGASLGQLLTRIGPDPDRHLFLSGELIYHHLADPGALTSLGATLNAHGYDDIRLLLFIRDRLPYHVSGWQQRLRSPGELVEGLSGDPASLVGQVHGLSRLLTRIAKTDGISLEVHSYDRPTAPLMDLVETWLELPNGVLQRPPPGRKNRSLTRSEAALTLAVNRAIGGRCELGQRLVNRVPDPAPDPLGLPARVQDRMTDALAEPLAQLNALLPDHAHVGPGRVPETDWGAPWVFSRAQLDVIADLMAGGGMSSLGRAVARPASAPGTPPRRRRKAPLWCRAIRPFDLRRWI